MAVHPRHALVGLTVGLTLVSILACGGGLTGSAPQGPIEIGSYYTIVPPAGRGRYTPHPSDPNVLVGPVGSASIALQRFSKGRWPNTLAKYDARFFKNGPPKGRRVYEVEDGWAFVYEPRPDRWEVYVHQDLDTETQCKNSGTVKTEEEAMAILKACQTVERKPD